MKSKIRLKKTWFDEDLEEFTVTVCDGSSQFESTVYVGSTHIGHLIRDLNAFRDQIYGGIYDLAMGEFGPEYANGAFLARLHFYMPGKLSISTFQQTEFFEFTDRKVAAEAKMYLRTEPILLDNFITLLKRIESGIEDEAELECT